MGPRDGISEGCYFEAHEVREFGRHPNHYARERRGAASRLPRQAAGVECGREIAPANVTREQRTLEDLAVLRTLAHDLDATLRHMGATRGDRVVGFTFRT